MKTRDFLATCARLVRTTGSYVRKDNKAELEGTAEAAYWILDEGKEDSLPEPEDYEVADAALAFANGIPLDASGYAKRVQAACAKSEVDFQKAEFVGSILDMAIRATEDADFGTDFAGSVSLDKPAGFVLAMRGVRIVQKRQIKVYGFDRNIVKFATAEGNILTWWASKMPEYPVGTILARFEARVKGPSEYNGIHETLVKNCQLVPKIA